MGDSDKCHQCGRKALKTDGKGVSWCGKCLDRALSKESRKEPGTRLKSRTGAQYVVQDDGSYRRVYPPQDPDPSMQKNLPFRRVR